jgi:lipopolysaccharide export system protein LptA
MDFDEHNQPRHGHLEGGVRLDSARGTRQIHGNSPAAELDFTNQGQLRHAHLERSVEMTSEDRTMTAATARSGPEPMRVLRTWRAPVTDVEFRNVKGGQVEPATIHGNGGVVITGESQRGKAAPVPSKLVADEVSGEFGPDSALTAMTGVGHAGIEETTATGSRQTASGDRLQAHFAPGAEKTDAPKVGLGGAAQIEQAVLDGHVVLTQTPAAKPAAPAPAQMRATAGKAVYEGAGEWLHLTVNPRVQDGAIELTADKFDVSQESGNALARGNVKATWLDASNKGQAAGKNGQGAAKDNMALGGQGPAHAIAQQAELQRANNQAVFTGHARLWQQANSIEGPVIVLDRDHKSLVSRSTVAAEPVRVVLLSAGGLDATQAPGAKASGVSGAKSSTPSVIRVHGGQLDYSDVERKAVMVDGGMGPVVAETGTATSISDRVELYLLPSGAHAGKDAPQGQVERMTASGHVVLSSPGRRGTGEQLTYTGSNGEYVLTGTPAAPPRMTDAARGNVTGEALIFDSRDDSVSIEGGGHETRTETTVRQGEGRSETQR